MGFRPMNEDRFISEHECQALTSLSRTTLYRLRKTQLFPQMIQISDGRKAYRLCEVLVWMNSRLGADAIAGNKIQ